MIQKTALAALCIGFALGIAAMMSALLFLVVVTSVVMDPRFKKTVLSAAVVTFVVSLMAAAALGVLPMILVTVSLGTLLICTLLRTIWNSKLITQP